MYTDKKSILQLATLLHAHGVNKIVLCPGSRNIPLVQVFANAPYFSCHPITDERSAGFFAIGLALQSTDPVAICCTSGTALLNLHPAVAEAYYQQVPLIVISADRPAAWIGQMDGQTLPQPGVFGPLVKMSVNLPEVKSKEDEWYCNRLINEAILESFHHGKGPVHINVPISEPFFSFPTDRLPKARIICRCGRFDPHTLEGEDIISIIRQSQKRMVVAGQAKPQKWRDTNLCASLHKHFAWFAESIANPALPEKTISRIEPLLYAMSEEDRSRMRPDLLVTYGGHIISKRLKKFLRAYPPEEHWHIAPDGKATDLFGALTYVIEEEPCRFWEQIGPMTDLPDTSYPQTWKAREEALPQAEFGYSEMGAAGEIIRRLPTPCALHLANSSTVRYAQFFPLPKGVKVYSNRGTNGIEGSLSTAIGYASASGLLNFIVIGDLSFFYDMNALWNPNYGSNIRILLLNNGGGEIFHALPGLELDKRTADIVTGTHEASGKAWAKDRGFTYLCAHDGDGLEAALEIFMYPRATARPMLLEVFTDPHQDVALLKDYYRKLKQ